MAVTMNVEEFLLRTECHFNWNLAALNEKNRCLVEVFKEKLDEADSSDKPCHLKWPLKLTYAYELFATEKEESSKILEEVIEEIEQPQNETIRKYQTSYQHIVYSFKAFTLVKSNGENSINLTNLLERIKPFADMTPIERSAVFATQAVVVRYYGPKGNFKGVPLLMESIRLNPEEIQFKIELVVSMNRKRHYDLNVRPNMTWSQYEEPVNILEQLLNHPELTAHQRETCEYLLAVIYYDYSFVLKKQSKWREIAECNNQIIKSCNWLHDKTNHPSIISFCAEKFYFLEKDHPKGMRTIKLALQRFPSNVGINTAACKLYRSEKDLRSAAKHAQIAADGGGFGAAWILLELKTELNEDFDDVEYFDNLLLRFSGQDAGHKKQIHLQASLYYFLKKDEVVKGARHMEMAVLEDPSYEPLKKCYSTWVHRNTFPLEVAYGKIVEALRIAKHSKDDLETLSSAKHTIEEVATFDLTKYGESEEALASSGGGRERGRRIISNYRVPRNFPKRSQTAVPLSDSSPEAGASCLRPSTSTKDNGLAPRSDTDSVAAVDVLVPLMRDTGFSSKATPSTTHSLQKDDSTDWRSFRRTSESGSGTTTNTRTGNYRAPMSGFNRAVTTHRSPLELRSTDSSRKTTTLKTDSFRNEDTTDWRKDRFSQRRQTRDYSAKTANTRKETDKQAPLRSSNSKSSTLSYPC